jgi:hypothetical protein
MSTWSKPQHWLFGLFLPLVAGLALTQIPAESQVERSKVVGQRHADLANFNLMQTCPDIRNERPSALETQCSRGQTTGSVRVAGELKSGEISDVGAIGGSREYPHPIKRTSARPPEL